MEESSADPNYSGRTAFDRAAGESLASAALYHRAFITGNLANTARCYAKRKLKPKI